MPDPAGVLAVARWDIPTHGEQAIDTSVLIPSFKATPYIAAALECIEKQRNLPNELQIEVIIVTDGDPADAAFIRRLIAARSVPFSFSIVLIELRKNVGAGLARCYGWLHCRGTFVAFLDDDDLWHPDKLSLQRDLHLRHPHQIASGHLYDDGSVPIRRSSTPFEAAQPSPISFAELLVRTKPATPTLMFRRSLWPRGPEPFRLGEDSLMMLMVAHQQPLLIMPLVLASRSPAAPPLRQDPHSLSRRRLGNRIAQWRNYVVLVQRAKLSPFWLTALLPLSLLLAGRRWILDLCAVVRRKKPAAVSRLLPASSFKPQGSVPLHYLQNVLQTQEQSRHPPQPRHGRSVHEAS